MKTRYLLGLCVAVMTGGTLIAAAVPAVIQAEENRVISDSWLTAKTKIALFADARVKGRQIEVETTQGRVTLSGTVDSEEARQASEDIAGGVSGIKGVTNVLEVAAPPTGMTPAQDDAVIMTRIKDLIMADEDTRLKQANITVRTSRGIVSLTGEVPDISTSAHASWSAWKTPGVKAVKNDLTVKEAT